MSTIRALQVKDWSLPPAITTIPPPSPPTASQRQIRLRAAGIHQLVKARAAGKHYTAGPLPHTPGVDGVGIDLATQKPVFFYTIGPGQGSFVEVLNVDKVDVFDVPDGVDPVAAAGFMNPVMSSYLGLTQRVDFLKDGVNTRTEGWSVLIMGVTSASGRLAVKVARHFGANKVVGAARGATAPTDLALDEYISLSDPEKTDFSSVAKIDVVLDYLYGPHVVPLLSSFAPLHPVTYVNVGTMAGLATEIPGALLRSKNVTVRGTGPGSWSMDDLRRCTPGMLEVLRGVGAGDLTAFSFEEVDEAWKAKGRVVFVV